jgi:hypothetical protein
LGEVALALDMRKFSHSVVGITHHFLEGFDGIEQGVKLRAVTSDAWPLIVENYIYISND